MNQQEYYDYLAQMGKWVNFSQMWDNRYEIDSFSKILFDLLCENEGFDAPFMNPRNQ